MTDLFTHWIDVVHWAMKSDQPRMAHMLGDKYIFEQWDCPDTIQAAFRYPGFDVVYEGHDEFVDRRRRPGISRDGSDAEDQSCGVRACIASMWMKGQNPVLSARSFRDGTITHMENFFDCIKTRKEPNAPVETGVAAARAGHIGNLAHLHGGQYAWPAKG